MIRLKSQIAFYALSFAAITSSCSDPMFYNSSQLQQVQDSNETTPGAEEMASEPVMVGGAFLACFIDYSLDTAEKFDTERLPFGCSLFTDSKYENRQSVPDFAITIASLVTKDGQILDLSLSRQEQHHRWSWLGYLPSQSGPYDMNITVTQLSTTTKTQTVSLLVTEALPPSLLPLGLLSTAEFKFRQTGTDLCLSGDPVWNNNGSVTEADQLKLMPCQEAISFRFSPWQDGYRVHTASPKQFTCDSRWYPQSFCERSCIDLANFGEGDEFELFACTYSRSAQLLRFQEIDGLSLKIQANGRYISIDEGQAEVGESNDPPASFEILTSPTINDR